MFGSESTLTLNLKLCLSILHCQSHAHQLIFLFFLDAACKASYMLQDTGTNLCGVVRSLNYHGQTS